MANDARVDTGTLGPFVTIHLEGSINETFSTDALLQGAAGKVVFIDVQGLSRITSFGSRQWIRAVNALCQSAKHVFLENCSFGFVSQLNMIRGFAGSATVLSVTAPVACGSCDQDMKLVVDLRNGVPKSVKTTCSRCGGTAELAEDLETYFGFARANLLSQMPPDLAALVHQYYTIRTARGATPKSVAVPPPRPQDRANTPVSSSQPEPPRDSAGQPGQWGAAREEAPWQPTETDPATADEDLTPQEIVATPRVRAAAVTTVEVGHWAVTNDVLLALLVGFLTGAFAFAMFVWGMGL